MSFAKSACYCSMSVRFIARARCAPDAVRIQDLLRIQPAAPLTIQDVVKYENMFTLPFYVSNGKRDSRWIDQHGREGRMRLYLFDR